MPSVDDVWADMKLSAKPKPSSSCASGAGGLGKLSQKAGMAKQEAHTGLVDTAELKVSVMDAKTVPGRGLMFMATKNQGQEGDDDMQDGMDREVQLMSSSDVAQRRGALSRLLTLANDTNCPPAVQRQAFQGLYVEVIKLMADPVERVRDSSLRVLLAFFDVLDPPTLGCSLPLLLPTLLHRVGSSPPMEPAEEVRLLCMLVTSRVMSLFGRRMGDYIEALDSICCTGMQDTHPLVRHEAANIITMLTRTLKAKLQQIVRIVPSRQGEDKHYRYGDLILALKPSLRHKHAKVRVATIEALKSLLLCGEKNLEVIEDLVCWQQPNVIPVWHFFNGGVWEDGQLVKPEERETQHNYLAVLAADTSPSVRACFLRMVADWMSSLHDRWDHESRLLPYLLNGLCDEVSDIRREAHECMERLGAVHEDEKGNNDRDKQELRDFREYGHRSPAELNSAERWAARAQEPPFTQRPRLGARMVVRNNFKRLVPTLVRELNCWQSKTRRMSGQLLYYLTLYTEHWITCEAHVMLQAYIKSAQSSILMEREGDPEGAELLRQAMRCSEALGMFIDPALWLPLLLPTVSGASGSDVEARSGCIAVLSALCRGCSRSWLSQHADTIVEALGAGPSDSPLVCSLLARAAGSVAAACSPLSPQLQKSLSCMLLSLQVKAWAAGARTLPPPKEGESEDIFAGLVARGRDWKGVQASCWEALDCTASKGGCAASLVSVQAEGTLLGCGGSLAWLEVILRQADLSRVPPTAVTTALSLLQACVATAKTAGQAAEALGLASLVLSEPDVACHASSSMPSLLCAALECAARGAEGAAERDGDGEGAGGGAAKEEEGFVLVESDAQGGAGAWAGRPSEALEAAHAALECALVILTDGSDAKVEHPRAATLLGEAIKPSLALQSTHIRQLACAVAQYGVSRLEGAPAGVLFGCVAPALADTQESVREAALAAMVPVLDCVGGRASRLELEGLKGMAATMVADGEGGGLGTDVVRRVEEMLGAL